MLETEEPTGGNPGNKEMNVDTTGQQETAAQTEPTGAENEKTFTQEEVDKIVEKRLNRERKKFSSILNGDDPREAELVERERAVAEKELRIEATETFMKENLPAELLDLLNYTDKESCEKSIELVRKTFTINVQAAVERRLWGGKPPKKAVNDPTGDLRGAFGLR